MITAALIAAFTSLGVAILNGLFLVVSRRIFDKNLALLNAQLSVIRDLAVRHFDRRADIYRDAVTPFSKLFVATGRGDESPEVVTSFQQSALESAALVNLFGSAQARARFNTMYDWTTSMLQTPRERRPANTSDAAVRHMREFLEACHDDLFTLPSVGATPPALEEHRGA